jgi:hypothetical protein
LQDQVVLVGILAIVMVGDMEVIVVAMEVAIVVVEVVIVVVAIVVVVIVVVVIKCIFLIEVSYVFNFKILLILVVYNLVNQNHKLNFLYLTNI